MKNLGYILFIVFIGICLVFTIISLTGIMEEEVFYDICEVEPVDGGREVYYDARVEGINNTEHKTIIHFKDGSHIEVEINGAICKEMTDNE